MTRPTVDPSWATDPSYSHGPVIGQPNKSQPSTAEAAEGFIPTEPIPADYLNYELNNHGSWLKFLDAALGAGFLGTGADGDLVFDGAATVLGMAPASGVYTLTRHVHAKNVTFTGNARVKEGGKFFLWAQGTVDTTGSAVALGTPLIFADGNDGVQGDSTTGGNGGAGVGGGAFAGSADGGKGGDLNGTGTAGSNITDALGGAGGLGGTGGSGVAHGNASILAGGAGGTATQPTAPEGKITTAPLLIGFTLGVTGSFATATGLLTALRGGAGGGGGGGGTDALGGGGGGGGGGGVGGVFANHLKLRTAADIRCGGGKGANGFDGGGGTYGGGGSGGGGGVCYIGYGSYETQDSSVFAVGINAPGGAGGAGYAPHGALNGAAGAVGILFEMNLGGSGGSLPTLSRQRGIASFAEGGSGDGFDYHDIALSPAMPDTNYEVLLSISPSSDAVAPPAYWYVTKTTAGFRIRVSAQFTGQVSWEAIPA